MDGGPAGGPACGARTCGAKLHEEILGGAVLIVADKGAKTGVLIEVMDQARLAGVPNCVRLPPPGSHEWRGHQVRGRLYWCCMITLGLFLLMTRMITGAAGTGPQAQHYNAVDFVRLVPDKHPQEKPRDKLPEKKPPPKPPPPPKLSAAQPDAPPPPDTAMPMPAIDNDLRLTGGPVIGRLAPGAASPAKDDEVIPRCGPVRVFDRAPKGCAWAAR